MTFVMVLAFCNTPGGFEDLWHLAVVCGAVLFIEGVVLLWRKRPLKLLSRFLLVTAVWCVSLWSLALAYAASRNTLLCAGVPGLSAAIIRQAEESYQTFLVFEWLTLPTILVGSMLVAAGIIVLFAQRVPSSVPSPSREP